MQIGIDSFAAAISDPATGLTLSPVERMHRLLEEIGLPIRSASTSSALANIIARSSRLRSGCNPLRCRNAHGKYPSHSEVTVLSASEGPEGHLLKLRKTTIFDGFVTHAKSPLRFGQVSSKGT